MISLYLRDKQTWGLLVGLRLCPKLINVDTTAPAICEATICPKELCNSRSGTLSAQVLYFPDKLNPGGLEFLLLLVLDFHSYLLVRLFFLN